MKCNKEISNTLLYMGAFVAAIAIITWYYRSCSISEPYRSYRRRGRDRRVKPYRSFRRSGRGRFQIAPRLFDRNSSNQANAVQTSSDKLSTPTNTRGMGSQYYNTRKTPGTMAERTEAVRAQGSVSIPRGVRRRRFNGPRRARVARR